MKKKEIKITNIQHRVLTELYMVWIHNSGFRSPTHITELVHGSDTDLHSSWSCPKLKILMVRGLIDRSGQGWYKISRKGINWMKRNGVFKERTDG